MREKEREKERKKKREARKRCLFKNDCNKDATPCKISTHGSHTHTEHTTAHSHQYKHTHMNI